MFIDCMFRALEVSWLYVTLIAIISIIIIIITSDVGLHCVYRTQQSRAVILLSRQSDTEIFYTIPRLLRCFAHMYFGRVERNLVRGWSTAADGPLKGPNLGRLRPMGHAGFGMGDLLPSGIHMWVLPRDLMFNFRCPCPVQNWCCWYKTSKEIALQLGIMAVGRDMLM